LSLFCTQEVSFDDKNGWASILVVNGHPGGVVRRQERLRAEPGDEVGPGPMAAGASFER